MITIETARLTLRPLTRADGSAVQKWASVPENTRYMPWGPNTDADTDAFLTACEKNWAAEPILNYNFGIVLNETGELIGACGVKVTPEQSTGEIGWILRQDHWRQGLTTEAAGGLIQYCFGTFGLHRLFAMCNADNVGSWCVMEHNGMRREGHYIKSRFDLKTVPPRWADFYEYAILKEEFMHA